MFWKPDFERFFCRNFTARNWNNQWGASWKMFKAFGKKCMEEWWTWAVATGSIEQWNHIYIYTCMYIRMFFFVFLDLTPATSHFFKVTAKPPTSVPCLTNCLAWGYLPPLPRVYPTRRKAAQYHLGSRQQEVLLPHRSGWGSVGRGFTSEPRSHANFARVRTVDMLGYMCFFVFCWVHFFGGSNLSIVQFLDGKSTVFSDWCRSPRFSHPLLFGGLLLHRPSHLRDRRKTALNEAQGRYQFW